MSCSHCVRPNESIVERSDWAKRFLSSVYSEKNKRGREWWIKTLKKRPEFNLVEGHSVENTKRIREIFDHLFIQGFLSENFLGQFELNFKSLQIISGVKRFYIPDRKNKIKKVVKKNKVSKKKIFQKRTTIETDGNDLFEHLRERRNILAKKRRIPAYKIFKDQTLREMASFRPQNEKDLAEIYGVGPRKIKKLGKIFLKLINEFN